MSETPLHYLTITELADRIRSGDLSPVEATQAQLDRIASLDGHLKSYATVMADHAISARRGGPSRRSRTAATRARSTAFPSP